MTCVTIPRTPPVLERARRNKQSDVLTALAQPLDKPLAKSAILAWHRMGEDNIDVVRLRLASSVP